MKGWEREHMSLEQLQNGDFVAKAEKTTKKSKTSPIAHSTAESSWKKYVIDCVGLQIWEDMKYKYSVTEFMCIFLYLPRQFTSLQNVNTTATSVGT